MGISHVKKECLFILPLFIAKLANLWQGILNFRTQKRSNSSNFKIFSGAFFSLLGDFRQLPGV